MTLGVLITLGLTKPQCGQTQTLDDAELIQLPLLAHASCRRRSEPFRFDENCQATVLVYRSTLAAPDSSCSGFEARSFGTPEHRPFPDIKISSHLYSPFFC